MAQELAPLPDDLGALMDSTIARWPTLPVRWIAGLGPHELHKFAVELGQLGLSTSNFGET